MQEITNPTDVDSLTILGHSAKTGKTLETFPNHHSERDYTVTLTTGEFTCLCPMTEQPDFAQITIKYIPDKLIVESKSLKLYLASFRSEGAFHEHVTNTILDDLVKTMAPRWCKVSASFAVRGGIAIVVDVEYQKVMASSSPPVPAEEPDKKGKSISGERQREERENYKSPSTRWEREKESSRPEGYANRSVRENRHAGQGENRPEREKRWTAEKPNRPEREKRWPAQRENRPVPVNKRSERKTTKSLGETRTWRKRI